MSTLATPAPSSTRRVGHMPRPTTPFASHRLARDRHHTGQRGSP